MPGNVYQYITSFQYFISMPYLYAGYKPAVIKLKREMVKLRAATQGDALRIRLLEKELIGFERELVPAIQDGDDIWYYDIAGIIDDHENSLLLVIEADNELVGCGIGQIRKNKHYYKLPYFGFIGMMCVKAAYRNNGYGGDIIKELLRWFKTKNIEEVRLTVFPNNPGAIKAYQKLGFEDFLLEMKLEI